MGFLVLKDHKYIRMGFLVLKDHKCLLLLYESYWTKLFVFQTGGKMRNISVSYRFQFRLMHFIYSCNYLSLFFYHNMTRAHNYIKAISQESKPRNSSDYKKNSKTTPNFASKMVDFTTHSRFHWISSDFESIVCFPEQSSRCLHFSAPVMRNRKTVY